MHDSLVTLDSRTNINAIGEIRSSTGSAQYATSSLSSLGLLEWQKNHGYRLPPTHLQHQRSCCPRSLSRSDPQHWRDHPSQHSARLTLDYIDRYCRPKGKNSCHAHFV